MQMTSTAKHNVTDALINASAARPPTTGLGRPVTTSESKTTTEPVTVPQFGGGVYALAARIAGRINAASISEDEHQDLLRERQALLDKMFGEGPFTRKERNRLEYVRWSLDRIDDAKNGYILDAIESSVTQYEHLLHELRDFKSQIDRQV